MFPSKHPSSSFPARSPGEPRAVALIDARYLRWLARLDEPDGAAGGKLSRERLNELVQQVLFRAGLRGPLLRIYWYTDLDDQATCDDQTLRLLPAADADGNALVRQMAQDLQALVASGRVDVALIASDDDRLAAPMDAAKMAGLTVCLLADERAQAMPRLMQQDPNWARLLREADRRLIVQSSDLAQALVPGIATAERAAPAFHDVDLEAKMQALVDEWWSELSADERESLREELPSLRGVPPEIDRELLLRGKNMLHRSLNFHEKRVLRERARRTAMDEEARDGALAESDSA